MGRTLALAVWSSNSVLSFWNCLLFVFRYVRDYGKQWRKIMLWKLNLKMQGIRWGIPTAHMSMITFHIIILICSDLNLFLTSAPCTLKTPLLLMPLTHFYHTSVKGSGMLIVRYLQNLLLFGLRLKGCRISWIEAPNDRQTRLLSCMCAFEFWNSNSVLLHVIIVNTVSL